MAGEFGRVANAIALLINTSSQVKQARRGTHTTVVTLLAFVLSFVDLMGDEVGVYLDNNQRH